MAASVTNASTLVDIFVTPSACLFKRPSTVIDAGYTADLVTFSVTSASSSLFLVSSTVEGANACCFGNHFGVAVTSAR
jgi:hypothetical protein